ncbi:hypothetical protein ABEB36_015302 [Hypothenemus hampei]|uniref:Transposable element P transposase n=1 Tax=Hypothenemus hampei TaxID=57062 RepID=A0ABD1DZS7_HYPHA
MTSDLGGGNRALYTELNISHTNTCFRNPANNQNVYVFADVPHLIKLIRNHFVDYGFILDGKEEIHKSIIEEVMDVSSTSDLKITHKISKQSLNVQGTERQKVKLATKLFSHTISMAISRCGTKGLLKQQNWLECADFFKLVNDWFDIMNIREYSSDTRDRRKAYGLALNVQDSILTRMSNTIENLRVKGRRCLLPFQKGIIMTNTSLKLLHDDLKTRFSTQYLLTYRLNQDVLENFFGAIRTKGGLHDHPDALQFKYRLRSYMLGRNEGSLSSFGNVEEDDTPDINLCGKYFSLFEDDSSVSDCKENLNTIEIELTDIEYDGWKI